MLFRETSKLLIGLFLLLLLPAYGSTRRLSEQRTRTVVGSMLFVDKNEKTMLSEAANVTIEVEHEGQIMSIVSDNNGDFIVKLTVGTYLLKSARTANNKQLRFSTSQNKCFKIEPDKDTRFDVMLLGRDEVRRTTSMKNIQVIDEALNCTYSIFAAEEDEFELLFPEGTDIEFNDDLFSRLGETTAAEVLRKVWARPVDKKTVHGIHGTLFYGFSHKKRYYPTKRDSEMRLVF